MLTKENYYSREMDLEYLSVSQYKDFMKCEYAAMAKLGLVECEYQPEEKEAFLFGNYIHSYFESPESHEEFKKENPSIFTKKGELLAKYKKADEMIEILLDDKWCMDALQGESEVMVEFNLFHTKWKMKIDKLNLENGVFTDLKTCRDIHERIYDGKRKVHFSKYYGYDIQMSIYRMGLYIKYFKSFIPIIVAISKTDIPEKLIIKFTHHNFSKTLNEISNNIPRILKLKSGELEPHKCENCEYCNSQSKVNSIIEFDDL